MRFGRRKRRKTRSSVIDQCTRPCEVECLAPARFDCLPQGHRLTRPGVAVDHSHGLLVLHELSLCLGPGALECPVGISREFTRRQFEILVKVARFQDPVFVMVAYRSQEDRASRQAIDSLRLRATLRCPPEVVVHSALTTKRGPAPPPVRRVAAALDDGGSTQGGELLDSDCEPLTDRRTALNVGEDAAVQPNAVTQACSPSRLTIRSDVRTERHSTPVPQVLKLLKISSHGNDLFSATLADRLEPREGSCKLRLPVSAARRLFGPRPDLCPRIQHGKSTAVRSRSGFLSQRFSPWQTSREAPGPGLRTSAALSSQLCTPFRWRNYGEDH